MMGHMRRRCTDQPTHSPTLDYSSTLYGTAVKHSAQQKTSTTTNPRTHHVCTTVQQQQYSSTAEKNKNKKTGTGGFELTCLGLVKKNMKKTQQIQGGVLELTLFSSRIERSTAEPIENGVIPCHLREGNFEQSSLAESG